MKKFLLTLSFLCAGVACLFAAACGKTTYTYEFNTNGGTVIEEIVKEKGEEFTLPIPEREGYSFEGWYLTEDFSGEAVETVVAEGNATYYAKWETLYAITLDLNGGTLSQSVLYLKQGENVYDFMQNYIPAKNGFVFGAWYNGESELAKNTRMPTSGLTLTAQYKVGYTVELWLQNTSLDGYEKSDSVQGYDYVGTEYTAEVKVTGFQTIENEQSVISKTLSSDETENIFKLFYDREEYSVTFMTNYPDGTNGANRMVTGYYGLPLAFPTDYLFEGYYLVGWSNSAAGDVDYDVNHIDDILYNKDGGQTAADKFIPERNTALYAVWNKGYIDMFGGNDYIYLFDDASKDIYLCRGNVYFKGEYTPATKEFLFLDASDEIVLEGKLNADGTYSYYNETRSGYSSTLYVVGEGLVESDVIYFDAYNGITYAERSELGINLRSNGTYVVDENGLYTATFTEGNKSGQTLNFVIGTVTVDNVQRNAFQVRNEEEYALGALVRFAVYNGSLTYYTSAYNMILSGFGVAYYNTGSSVATYYYTMDHTESLPAITLMNSNGNTVGVAKVMTGNGTLGYMFYDSDLDQTYASESGEVLVLDGICNATYTKGGVSITGYYTAASSIFGGTIITFSSSNLNTCFLISSKQQGDDSSLETVYYFEEKAAGYAEYYYKDTEGVYRAPLIVINDGADGKATVYGFNTSTGGYEKASAGTVIWNESTELYLYTADEYFECEVSTDRFDLSQVKSFVFNVGVVVGSSTSYNVNFWYSATIEGEEDVKEYYDRYSSEKNGKLTLVGGFAVYEEEGQKYKGTYSTDSANENLLIISVTVGANSGYIYVEINRENHTFLTLDTAPYKALAVQADGSISQDEALAFDGKGGAVYTVGDESYSGYVSSANNYTDSGYLIYVFRSEDGTLSFEFIQLSTSSARYFSKYNGRYCGTYRSQDGILVLDGYGLYATYTDTNGVSQNGMYFIQEDNVVVMYTGSEYRYFDFDDDMSFTVRGTEYGTYILMDNQAANGTYLTLDGYGKLSVFKVETDENGENNTVYLDENGRYAIQNDTVTLRYADGNKDITLIGELGTYTYASRTYSIFIVKHEEILQTFVNVSDWSVLILDDVGNVTKYNNMGVRENGTYTIITEDLLYYVNDEATDASIFKYSVTEGTITPISFTARGYYTTDLESLLFSKYGFAIFNGETRYYYYIENGNVTIYRRDATDNSANKYGFVEENFGKFENVIEYEGKTYYANDGYSLEFNRKEESKDLYPVRVSQNESYPLEGLYFTPSGGAEFVVSGIVFINGKSYDCYVTRAIKDDGEAEMYVTIGNFRFDIDLTYGGRNDDGSSNCYYEVVGLKNIQIIPSYNYLYYYYIIYMFYGQANANSFANTLGEISIIVEYDEYGVAGDPLVSATFGPNSGIYDVNGELISFRGARYEYNSGTYFISFDGSDGYQYNLYFGVKRMSILNTYGYQLYAMVRMQTLIDPVSGLTVTVGRIIASENTAYPAGAIFSVQLFEGDQQIEADSIRYFGTDLYYIVRETDENGLILSTIYYKIELREKTGDLIEGEDEKVVPIYDTVNVTAEAVETYYSDDKASYVDVCNNEIKLLNLNGSVSTVSACEYDDETGIYTVTTRTGKNYTVTIEENVATVVEIVDEAEENGNESI